MQHETHKDKRTGTVKGSISESLCVSHRTIRCNPTDRPAPAKLHHCFTHSLKICFPTALSHHLYSCYRVPPAMTFKRISMYPRYTPAPTFTLVFFFLSCNLHVCMTKRCSAALAISTSNRNLHSACQCHLSLTFTPGMSCPL